MTAFDELKQAVADALALVSEHEDAVKTLKATSAAIRRECPGFQLECVFLHIPVGGGSYASREVERRAAELLSVLNDSERTELRNFVATKLSEAEQLVAAALRARGQVA